MKNTTLDKLENIVRGKRTKEPKAAPSIDAKSFADRVEKKAYELYQRRGYRSGQDWQDWFDAEKLVEDELIAGK